LWSVVRKEAESADKMEERSELKQSQIMKTLSSAAQEEKQAEITKRKPLYLTMIPAAMMKFNKVPKTKNADEEVNITIPTETAEPEEQNLEETCGLRYVVIPYCQRFNDIRCFLFFYCILVMCQGIIFGLVDLSHASFHKEYDVKTSEKLVLALTYDVSSCLVAVFVAYYGGKMNRIKWIAFSSFLIGLGSFFFALPYFSAKVHKSVMEMEGIGDASEILGYGLGYTIGAPQLKGPENSTTDERTGELGNLTAPCNSHCKCSSSIFYSVCGRDEVEYFSPCFAGCKRSKTLNYEKAYYNCSCIKNGLLSSDIEGEFFDALPGKCDTKCYKLPLFFAFFFSSIIFSCFSAVPLNLTIFRIVPERLHSLALGLSYVILRLLGTIPGPLIFEWTIQTSCTFRDSNKCGRKGRCWIFNKTYLAFILVGICSFCKTCTIILSAVSLHIYKHHALQNINSPSASARSVKPKKMEKTDL
uniref:Kazal-like domain-containing protein n=1 Tax=Castor canadensis TaxID=51338 RepID=A0A8C0WMQ1_CASCN